MHQKWDLLPWIACIMLLMLASCAWGAEQYYDSGISDEDYISIARAHPDAQAFLEEYPQAEAIVDRSGRLAVDFRVTTHSAISTTQQWEGIRLRIFLDPETNQPTDALFQCNERVYEDNVRQNMDRYFAAQACP
jgi:hypothetical protein